MNLTNVQETVLNLFEKFPTNPGLNDQDFVVFLKENSEKLSNDELMYSLSLYWAKIFQDQPDESNRLTPFSVTQIIALIVNSFNSQPKKIIDLKPEFPDLAIDVAISMNVNSEYPNNFETDYLSFLKTKIDSKNNLENSNNVFISNAIHADIEDILDGFTSKSTKNDFLFALVSSSIISDSAMMYQLLSTHQDTSKLIGMISLPTNAMSTNENISLLVFYNNKDDLIKRDTEILALEVPSIDNLDEISTTFKKYLDDWVKNNLGA